MKKKESQFEKLSKAHVLNIIPGIYPDPLKRISEPPRCSWTLGYEPFLLSSQLRFITELGNVWGQLTRSRYIRITG